MIPWSSMKALKPDWTTKKGRTHTPTVTHFPVFATLIWGITKSRMRQKTLTRIRKHNYSPIFAKISSILPASSTCTLFVFTARYHSHTSPLCNPLRQFWTHTIVIDHFKLSTIVSHNPTPDFWCSCIHHSVHTILELTNRFVLDCKESLNAEATNAQVLSAQVTNAEVTNNVVQRTPSTNASCLVSFWTFV